MDKRGRPASEKSLFRIPSHFYLHVLDQNTNVTRLEIGPKTYIRQDNERVVFGPERMITVPPRHYGVNENPVVTDADNKPVFDTNGQTKLMHADQDICLAQGPFPLFPRKILKQPVYPLNVVVANPALRLRAVLDFEEDDVKKTAGDEWLCEGPEEALSPKPKEPTPTLIETAPEDLEVEVDTKAEKAANVEIDHVDPDTGNGLCSSEADPEKEDKIGCTSVQNCASVCVYTDAAATKGFAGYCGKRWFSEAWPEGLEPQDISWMELHAAVVGIQMYACGHPLVASQTVVFVNVKVDNEHVADLINKKKKRRRKQKLSRLLQRLDRVVLNPNLIVHATLISKSTNGVADCLSRFKINKARKLAPDLAAQKDKIPDKFLPWKQAWEDYSTDLLKGDRELLQ